jgi:hypothetical protein
VSTHRKAFNKKIRVKDGTALGGAVRINNVDARFVFRDRQAGGGFSPPWQHWMTYPNTALLYGAQSSDLGAFDLTQADQVESNDGVFFYGYVMWWETWLVGDASEYRRAYINDGLGGGGGGGPGTPGPNCPLAGNYTLGVPYTGAIPIAGSDWWTFPVAAGLSYTITIVDNTGNLGATAVQYGTCAAPTLLGFGFFYPYNFNWIQPVNSMALIQVNGNLMAVANYTMTITSP